MILVMSGEPNYLDRARRVLHDGLGDASKQEPNKPAMSRASLPKHKVSSPLRCFLDNACTGITFDRNRSGLKAAPGESLRNRIHQRLCGVILAL